MSVGNITPRTADFTRTGMLLGSEVYPSVISQADMQNAGYLLYKPALLYSGAGFSRRTDTSGIFYNTAYLLEGKYDIICAVYVAGENAANGTLSFDGTAMAILDESSPYSGTMLIGTITGFNVASNSAYSGVVAFDFPGVGGALDALRGWSVYARQYEE